MLVRILLIGYFLIPKIDIFYVPGSLTGVRAQDFIILLLILSRGVLPKRALELFPILFLCIFGSIASNLPVQFFFGALRFIEYCILGFFIYEYILMKDNFFKRFVVIIVFSNLFLGVLQYLQIMPNFDPGRGYLISSQFAGFYGTPAELSYFFVCLIYVMLIKENFRFLRVISMFPIFNGVALGALVVLILGPLLALFKTIGVNKFLFLIFVLVSIVILFIFTFYNEILFDFVEVVVAADPSIAGLKSSGMSIDGLESLGQRLGKWANSIAYLIDHPWGLLFGVGIYSQGGALDGGLLRLFFEFGLLISFYVLYVIWNVDVRFFILFVSVNLTFDAYINSIVSPLLFGIYFYHLKMRKTQ